MEGRASFFCESALRLPARCYYCVSRRCDFTGCDWGEAGMGGLEHVMMGWHEGEALRGGQPMYNAMPAPDLVHDEAFRYSLERGRLRDSSLLQPF